MRHGYLTQFGGIVPAEKIEEMILLEAVFQGLLLGEGPFEIAAGSPIGITFKVILSRRGWIPCLYKYKGGEDGLFTMVAPRFSREKLG